jgi:hypothetical protein
VLLAGCEAGNARAPGTPAASNGAAVVDAADAHKPPVATARASSAPVAAVTPQRAAQALITRDHTLTLRELDSGKERTIVALHDGAYPTFPTWSADGSRIAFVSTGLYRLSSDGRALKHLADGAVHGQLALTGN